MFPFSGIRCSAWTTSSCMRIGMNWEIFFILWDLFRHLYLRYWKRSSLLTTTSVLFLEKIGWNYLSVIQFVHMIPFPKHTTGLHLWFRTVRQRNGTSWWYTSLSTHYWILNQIMDCCIQYAEKLSNSFWMYWDCIIDLYYQNVFIHSYM